MTLQYLMKEFKILTHLGDFVSENKLHDGIYSCETPHLRPVTDTIESMIYKAKQYYAIAPNFQSKDYIENLSLCELIMVKLSYWQYTNKYPKLLAFGITK